MRSTVSRIVRRRSGVAVVSLCLLCGRHAEGRSLQFLSGGKTIHLEEHCVKRAASAPSVMFLYGSGGPSSRNLPYREEVQRLTREGYCVYAPHYLDATGGAASDLQHNYAVWVQVVEDAAAYMEQNNGASRGRIALVGYSLGASVALAAASNKPGFGAVITISGSLPDRYFAETVTFPPLLIMHGGKDNVVPVYNATQLAALCKRRVDAICELSIYPGEGHAFGAGARLRIADEMDTFLARYLPLH